MFFEAHGNRAGNRKEFSNYGSDSSLSAILSAFLKKNETYLKFLKKNHVYYHQQPFVK